MPKWTAAELNHSIQTRGIDEATGFIGVSWTKGLIAEARLMSNVEPGLVISVLQQVLEGLAKQKVMQ